MKSTTIKAISILLITLIFSCSSEKEATKTIPQVTTTTATNITYTNASIGGNISADGGATVTSKGVVWSTISAPTISLTSKTSDGTGTGYFSSAISNLSGSTRYYARAYATNSVGTGYGNEITFTTEAIVLPTLTTAVASNITSDSAVSGGTITSNGGSVITARGIVWSTTQNPTITLTTKTTDATSTENFSSTITGLTRNKTYYVRAYATNSLGTAYGNSVSFTTTATTVPSTTTIIGTQTWLNTNLDVSTYSDGTAIPQVTDPTLWANLTTGAWCYHSNSTANGTTYGKLYNWYAVAGIWNEASKTNLSQRKKLAPTGYHIPSNSEWNILITYLGGESIAGGKLKSIGTTIWTSPNTGATNSSGFYGLPGGYRYSNGSFGYYIGTFGTWWSSSESNIANASTRILYHNYGSIGTNIENKASGFSVRCLKD